MSTDPTAEPTDKPTPHTDQPTMSTPGFRTQTYVIVTCCTCRRDYEDTEENRFLFASVDEAIDSVTEAGWWVTPQAVQCVDCAARQACAELGHAWDVGGWRACGCGCVSGNRRPIRSHIQPMQYRRCASCCHHQLRALHPREAP